MVGILEKGKLMSQTDTEFEAAAKRGECFKIFFQFPEGAEVPKTEANPADWHDKVMIIYPNIPVQMRDDDDALVKETSVRVQRIYLTTFYHMEGMNIGFHVGDSWLGVKVDESMWKKIESRNRRKRIERPPEGRALAGPPAQQSETHSASDTFPARTGQETRAITDALADGKHRKNWQNIEQDGIRWHQRPGSRFRVELQASDIERTQGIEALMGITDAHDTDSILTFFYILHQLSPPKGFDYCPNEDGTAWIDLADVVKKTLPGRQSAEESFKRRRKVMDVIEFGCRAKVRGARSGTYYDQTLGRNIDTRISSFVWSIKRLEEPAQGSLFPGANLPVKVEIRIEAEFAQLLQDPLLQQFLPFMERIASIPGGQPAGTWARTLGYVLCTEWRIKPEEAISGKWHLTRKELLDRLPPKIAVPEEILSSSNPSRAVDYWRGAMQYLVEQGILSPEGEATDCKTKQYPRQGWKTLWLNEPVYLTPADDLKAHLAMIAGRKFVPAKPRDLKALPGKAKRKQGRPRRG